MGADLGALALVLAGASSAARHGKARSAARAMERGLFMKREPGEVDGGLRWLTVVDGGCPEFQRGMAERGERGGKKGGLNWLAARSRKRG